MLIFDDVLTSLATYDSPPIWRKPQMIILERYCLNWTRNIYEKQNNLPNWFRKIKDKMKEIQNRDLRVRSKRLMLSRIFRGHSAIDFGWHWRTDNDMGRTVTKDTPGHNNDHILQMQSKNIGCAETNNILCSCVFKKSPRFQQQSSHRHLNSKTMSMIVSIWGCAQGKRRGVIIDQTYMLCVIWFPTCI